MSAFIVHPEHIRTLIWGALNYTRPGTTMHWHVPDPGNAANPDTLTASHGNHYRTLSRDSAEVIGQILLDQNARSVNHLYDEDEPYIYSHAAPSDTRWTPVELLSALACYEYQACETPQWNDSEAHAFCERLRHTLVSTLPGYSTGPWEITPDSKPYAVEQALAARARS